MRILLIMDDPSDLQSPAGSEGDFFESITAHFEEDELLEGLRDAGHEVTRLRGLRRLLNDIASLRATCDLALNCSDGLAGPDSAAWAASILDTAGIPYMGAPGLSLALQRDKALTKMLARTVGARTPPSGIIASARDELPVDLPFPAIVKPIGKGSSIGVIKDRSIANDRRAAKARALELIELYGQPALVETFVRGIEVEVPILSDPDVRALGVVATGIDGTVIHDDMYLTSEIVKNTGYEYMDLPSEVAAEPVMRLAEATARALGVRDYGRVDFRIDMEGTPWLIEANGHPSLQRHSCFAWLGRRKRFSYPSILDAMVRTCAWRTRLLSPPNHSPWTDL